MADSEGGSRGSSLRLRAAAIEGAWPTPLRFGDDPYVWASWLYYQEGMTQNDIAQAMVAFIGNLAAGQSTEGSPPAAPRSP